MDIITYKVTDNAHMIPKHMSAYSSITGTVRGRVSVEAPYIIIERNHFLDFNYIYIQEFKRYYYVTDQVPETNEMLGLVCKCDVLQSFYTQFVNCPMIAARSSSAYNSYIKDDNRKFLAYTKQQYITIGTVSPPNAMLLVATGTTKRGS